MKQRMTYAALFLTGVLGLVGCGGGSGKLHMVEGTVTVDGVPLEGATVTFTNTSGKLAAGLTSASGKFKLLTGGQEGCPDGTYEVTVTKSASKPPTVDANADPTKAYTEMMKQKGISLDAKGNMNMPKEKSEVPDRYTKPGTIPNQVVPTTGEVKIEMSSKK